MSGPRKTAIVIGASQGIGAGIVEAFVERGCNVMANALQRNRINEAFARLESGMARIVLDADF